MVVVVLLQLILVVVQVLVVLSLVLVIQLVGALALLALLLPASVLKGCHPQSAVYQLEEQKKSLG